MFGVAGDTLMNSGVSHCTVGILTPILIITKTVSSKWASSWQHGDEEYNEQTCIQFLGNLWLVLVKIKSIYYIDVL